MQIQHKPECKLDPLLLDYLRPRVKREAAYAEYVSNHGVGALGKPPASYPIGGGINANIKRRLSLVRRVESKPFLHACPWLLYQDFGRHYQCLSAVLYKSYDPRAAKGRCPGL